MGDPSSPMRGGGGHQPQETGGSPHSPPRFRPPPPGYPGAQHHHPGYPPYPYGGGGLPQSPYGGPSPHGYPPSSSASARGGAGPPPLPGYPGPYGGFAPFGGPPPPHHPGALPHHHRGGPPPPPHSHHYPPMPPGAYPGGPSPYDYPHHHAPYGGGRFHPAAHPHYRTPASTQPGMYPEGPASSSLKSTSPSKQGMSLSTPKASPDRSPRKSSAVTPASSKFEGSSTLAPEVEQIRAAAAAELTQEEVQPIQSDFHFFVKEFASKYRPLAEEEVSRSIKDKALDETTKLMLINTNLNTRLKFAWEQLSVEERDAYASKEDADRRRFMEEDEIASRHCATLTARGKNSKKLSEESIETEERRQDVSPTRQSTERESSSTKDDDDDDDDDNDDDDIDDDNDNDNDKMQDKEEGETSKEQKDDDKAPKDPKRSADDKSDSAETGDESPTKRIRQ